MESQEGFDGLMQTMNSMSGVLAGIEPIKEEIVREFVLAKEKPFPEKLHHYTDTKGVCGIVQSNHLWATDFRALNDSTELLHGASLLINELERFGDSQSDDVSRLLIKLASYYRDHGETFRTIFDTYIISFSEAPDVLSQWRAYADHAKGCCVEFDLTDSRLFTIADDNTPWALDILPVIYDESLQKSLIRSGIERLIGYLNSTDWTVHRIVQSSETEQGIILGLLIHAFEPFLAAFKHPGFSEEKEWRAVASCLSAMVKSNRKTRTSNSETSNYLECIFVQGDHERLWQRELLPITGVKYGPLADSGTKDEIEKLLISQGFEKQVVYSESIIPLKK